jgi:pup-ligase protein
VAEMLMGIETEYAVTGISRTKTDYDRKVLLDRLLALMRNRYAYLNDFGSGVFLQNGARFYLDTGLHPEMSTPECTNPWLVVRYILAGERILSGLACELETTDTDIDQVMVFKTNVDYGGTYATWGCHESYMHRASLSLMSREIIPHLVSRVIYTGAGGFNSLSPGLDFTLSPRVSHLDQVTSENSTYSRGIFHTKDEPLARDGSHRLHIICGESLCSETAMWLKVATTAIVVAMIEARVCQAGLVQLASPLDALRIFATDPDCKSMVRMADNKGMSAIEIQYHYLTRAEAHLGAKFMPAWAEEVCAEWRAMLNRLLDAPHSASDRLDWAIKLALYVERARRRRIRWESLRVWSEVLKTLQASLTQAGFIDKSASVDFILSSTSPVRDEVKRLAPYIAERGLSWGDLSAVLALRQELFEIDARFSQLGPSGIFSALDRAGVLNHRVAGVSHIEHAMANPPSGCRARIRGEFIRRVQGDQRRYRCDWQSIWDAETQHSMDLADPFETQERWKELPEAEKQLYESYYSLRTQPGCLAGVRGERMRDEG